MDSSARAQKALQRYRAAQIIGVFGSPEYRKAVHTIASAHALEMLRSGHDMQMEYPNVLRALVSKEIERLLCDEDYARRFAQHHASEECNPVIGATVSYIMLVRKRRPGKEFWETARGVQDARELSDYLSVHTMNERLRASLDKQQRYDEHGVHDAIRSVPRTEYESYLQRRSALFPWKTILPRRPELLVPRRTHALLETAVREAQQCDIAMTELRLRSIYDA